jgi:hypothetical protein
LDGKTDFLQVIPKTFFASNNKFIWYSITVSELVFTILANLLPFLNEFGWKFLSYYYICLQNKQIKTLSLKVLIFKQKQKQKKQGIPNTLSELVKTLGFNFCVLRVFDISYMNSKLLIWLIIWGWNRLNMTHGGPRKIICGGQLFFFFLAEGKSWIEW